MRKLLLGSAIAALPLPALAAVDADGLWEIFTAGAPGYVVTHGAVADRADGVTVRDVIVSSRMTEDPAPDASGPDGAAGDGEGAPVTRISVPVLVMTDEDGEVRATLPEGATMSAGGKDATLTSPDLALVLSGDVGDLRVNGSASALTIGGARGTSPEIVMSGMSVSAGRTAGAGTVEASGQMTVDRADIRAPGGEASFGGVSVKGGASLPAPMLALLSGPPPALTPENAELYRAASLELEAGAESCEGAAAAPAGGPGDTFSCGPASVMMSVSDGRVSYGLTASGLSGETTVPVLGLRTSYGVAEERLFLSVPIAVLKGEADEPFEASALIKGVTFGETLWSRIDPNGALPRDPGSLTFRLTGTLGAGDGETGGAPFAPRSINLESSGLSFAGVEATASGKAEAETGLLTSGEGSGEVVITGLKRALDALSGAGLPLVPRDAWAAFRAAEGGLFVIDEAGDRMTMKAEFGDGGMRLNGEAP
ncbi:MAG: hypothetical protein DI629_20355 [Mesorhizobium amorphae]|nr:MAG: hypothetical protein DI629_20355 [Mesorhizobium amorphae]